MSGRTATAALDQGTRGITPAGLNATLATPSYRWFRRPFPGASLVQVRRNGTAGGTHPTTCRVRLRRRHAGNAEMILAAPLCPAVGRDVHHGDEPCRPGLRGIGRGDPGSRHRVVVRARGGDMAAGRPAGQGLSGTAPGFRRNTAARTGSASMAAATSPRTHRRRAHSPGHVTGSGRRAPRPADRLMIIFPSEKQARLRLGVWPTSRVPGVGPPASWPLRSPGPGEQVACGAALAHTTGKDLGPGQKGLAALTWRVWVGFG